MQFIATALQDSPWNNVITWDACNCDDNYHRSSWESIHLIPTTLFATVGLFLVLYIHHSWGLVATVLARSQVARNTMRSTMLASWMLFPWLMAQHYIATKAMADTIRQNSLFILFKGVYTPQVTAGYVQSGSFLVILFLEAPFFCGFFFHKATELHNRRQQLSKTDCRLYSAVSVWWQTSRLLQCISSTVGLF